MSYGEVDNWLTVVKIEPPFCPVTIVKTIYTLLIILYLVKGIQAATEGGHASGVSNFGVE